MWMTAVVTSYSFFSTKMFLRRLMLSLNYSQWKCSMSSFVVILYELARTPIDYLPSCVVNQTIGSFWFENVFLFYLICFPPFWFVTLICFSVIDVWLLHSGILLFSLFTGEICIFLLPNYNDKYWDKLCFCM